MPEIVVFGSCMIDIISYVSRMPKAGETLHSTSYETGFGGKGANQCIAASRLGSRTAMIGKLGDDPYGAEYLKHFESEGVNTAHLELVNKQHSGVALIVVAADGSNQIVINANANSTLSEMDVEVGKDLLKEAKILICQLETPLAATVKALREFQGFSILNAAPAMQLTNEVLHIPDVFCLNEMESLEMTGIEIKELSDAKKTIEVLIERGCRMVVLTLGKQGAAFNEVDGKILHIEAPRVVVVDTVGAGDAFIGALAHFVCRYPDATWTQKVGAAIAIASHSVQTKGTQSSFVNFPRITPTVKCYTSIEL